MYRSVGSLWYWFFHSMWFERGSQLHSSLPFCISPFSTFHAFLSVTYAICHVSLPESLWWFSCLCLVGFLGLQRCSVHMAFIEFQGFKIGVQFHHCTGSAFTTEMSLQLHSFTIKSSSLMLKTCLLWFLGSEYVYPLLHIEVVNIYPEELYDFLGKWRYSCPSSTQAFLLILSFYCLHSYMLASPSIWEKESSEGKCI